MPVPSRVRRHLLLGHTPEGREFSLGVLGRNVHVGRQELDLVAVDPGPPAALVVVEVRWRRRRDFGLPEETVDHRKRTRIRQAAYGLLDRADLPHLPLRFDIVVVEPGREGGPPRVRHHRAAF